MYELTVDSHFSSAHFLEKYDGACSRVHGHTWRVSVTLASEELDERGICMDFKDISRLLESITDQFDHRPLNELEYFREMNPTAENIARVIHDLMESAIGVRMRLIAVTVAESDRYRVTYRK